MFRRLLSLMLVATIAACPFFCTLNGATAKVSGEKPHPCCDCCHANHSPEQSQHPDGSKSCPPISGKACQCICGGAISEVRAAPDDCIDLNVWAILPIETYAVSRAPETTQLLSISQLQPDDGHNLGRTMRCLLCSFVC